MYQQYIGALVILFQESITVVLQVGQVLLTNYSPSYWNIDQQMFCFYLTLKECEHSSLGHFTKDLKVEQRQFSSSEVLVLDISYLST